jgi:hypothetical protein
MNKNNQVSAVPNSLVLLKIQLFCKDATHSLEKEIKTSINLVHKNTSYNAVVEKIHIELLSSNEALHIDTNNKDWFEANVFVHVPALVNFIEVFSPNISCAINLRILPIFIKPNERNAWSDSINSINDFLVKKYANTLSTFFNTESVLGYIANVVSPMIANEFPVLDVNYSAIGSSSVKRSLNIAFLGNDFLYGLLDTTFNVTRIDEATLKLVKNNYFDLIVIQEQANQVLPFGVKEQEREQFTDSLVSNLYETDTPVVTLSSKNGVISEITPIRNIEISESFEVLEGSATSFIPLKEEVDPYLIVVPVASDLYQYPLFLDAVKQLVEYGFKLVICEANYGHVSLRTWELFNESPKVKVYGTLDPYLLNYICKKANFMFFSSRSLRNQKDLVSLGIIGLTSGCIPVRWGAESSDYSGHQFTVSKNTLSELYDYFLSNTDFLTREAHWLKLFRAYQKFKMEFSISEVIEGFAKKLDVIRAKELSPFAEMICVSKRPDNLGNIIKSFNVQSYKHLSLHIIWNVSDQEKSKIIESSRQYLSDKVKISFLDESNNIGACLNYGIVSCNATFWFKIDDDDYYGKFYIEDLVNWYQVTGADSVGKPSAVVKIERTNEHLMRNHTYKQVRTFLPKGKYLCGATLSGRKESNLPLFSNFYRNACDSKWIEFLHESGCKLFVADFCNFIIHRGELGQHTWKVEEQKLKEGSVVISESSLEGIIDAG